MSAGHDDYASEPIPGLPERLPEGEYILWQGAPQWWELAKQAFHIRGAAVYFLLLMAWRVSDYIAAGKVGAMIVVALSLLPFAIVGLGLLVLLAWLCSRTSIYTITNRRIVMRIGVALPTAINIPFKVIVAAGLRQHAHGAGDIYVAVGGADRIAYSNLWPHVRPWRLTRPEPMLRGILGASGVAEILRDALALASSSEAVVISPIKDPDAKAPPRALERPSLASGQPTASQAA